jgi:hypothetical protein
MNFLFVSVFLFLIIEVANPAQIPILAPSTKPINALVPLLSYNTWCQIDKLKMEQAL